MPQSFNYKWVLIYVGGAFLGVIFFILLLTVFLSLISKKLDALPPAADAVFEKEIQRRPWSLLFSLPAEDGLFLVPIAIIGINPIAAGVSGILFGIAHYPLHSKYSCVFKGIFYFSVALWILPHGILAIVLGHILLDAYGFYLITRQPEADPDFVAALPELFALSVICLALLSATTESWYVLGCLSLGILYAIYAWLEDRTLPPDARGNFLKSLIYGTAAVSFIGLFMLIYLKGFIPVFEYGIDLIRPDRP